MSLCTKTKCQYLWKIEKSHRCDPTNPTVNSFRSPSFLTCSGKECYIALNQQRPVNINARRVSRYMAIIFPGLQRSLESKDFADNYTYSITYPCINDKDKNVSIDIQLKMKREMETPPIILGIHPFYTSVKEIKVTIFITSPGEMPNRGKCSLVAHKRMATYLDGMLSDITIQVKDKKFRAHRVLLAAHSEVLKTMFKANMLEQESGVVTVKDLEPNAIEELLKYVYSHQEPMFASFESAQETYRAAHKYQIHDLLEVSRENLVKLLCEDTLLDLLVLCHKFSDQYLQNAVMLFCTDHPEFHPDPEKCRKILNETPDIFALFVRSLRAIM